MEGTSKNKIKILFLIPTLEMGGAEIQLLELVKNLNKAIFDITVGVFYANGRLSADFLDIPEIDVRFFGTKNKIGFSRVRNLVAFLKSHSVDIIEMWNISTKTIGILIAKIFTISNTIVRERTADYIFSGFGSVLYTFTDRLSATKAKMVIANSEAGRNFAIRKGIQPQRIQVIYNSLSSIKMRADKEPEQLRYELGLQKNQPIIGMIARLIRQKDPISFLRAAQIVLKSHSNASFLVVGNGPLYQELYKKAKTFGIDKKVLFTGERRDVPDLLNLIDIVVLPSNLTEGCSNAVMEAMYMGNARKNWQQK